nr:MAG TPA: Cas system-associated RAMP superfamily protein [Caudoviricetes sp.]
MVYCVKFRVKSPVIVSTPIHFDAILSAVHPAMHNLNTVVRRSQAEDVVDAPLPIDSAKIADTWVFCCSSADYSNARPYCTKFTKRKDGLDYCYIKSRQTPRSGPGRDRCDTIYGVLCSSVDFFVSCGSVNELSRLCRRVHGIGGLRKMGFGEVTEFEIIERTDLQWQDCLVRDGVAVRNLPVEMIVGQATRLVATKHPYWLADHLRPGVEEGDAAELREEVYLNEYIEYFKSRRTDKSKIIE